jgi:S1-C subfamily serine protease
LGVRIQTIDAEMAKALETSVESGALITNIEPRSAAEDAGLEVGDIIIGVNEKDVADASELRNTIGLLRSGDKVKIKYVRDSKTRSTTAELGQARAQQLTGADIHPGLEGATFAAAAATADSGVEVSEVAAGSPAAQRGLRAGDLITAVNRTRVRNLQDLAAIAADNRILFLLVQRGDRSLMLQIR